MLWLKWLPWRYLLRRAARSHGFIDPIVLLARLRSFAQPSEVAEPIELLRAGAVFHARGLINSRVIQHNLDWVWPYWVERQFDPRDDGFLPRAFSLTHVNLTHRNWTAIGTPGCDEFPLVDPGGLLTPFFDGWSLDAWCVADDGRRLLPSRSRSIDQTLHLGDGLAVVTKIEEDGMALTRHATVVAGNPEIACHLSLEARTGQAGWLVLALRPYNPEGISFIHHVALATDRASWTINGQHRVAFGAAPERHHTSDYHSGDVAIHLSDARDQDQGRCQVGMVTAAALFRLEPAVARRIDVTIPLGPSAASPSRSWNESLAAACVLDVPDEQCRFLYDAALRTLVLHSPELIYPGPYTYKRFWFRDACFLLHAMLCAGLHERAEGILDRFPAMQTVRGYFHSQEGEWDSNGEVLWIFDRFCQLTGRPLKAQWWTAVVKGARWIGRKRLKGDKAAAHAGLMPAGFSAEHLGTSDYYYWDDFWSLGGLRAAAAIAGRSGDEVTRRRFEAEADDLDAAIERSLATAAERLGTIALSASPYRRLDAGAIGSIAAGYPLQLWRPDEPRLLATAEFLLQNCFVAGGFFQDMIHSGINVYLTLHIAQILLRAGDARASELVDAVARLASPTGQWPEAIHPRTMGGCMGDGQHVWAAAEWIMVMRNSFVREEDGILILLGGIPARWIKNGTKLRFGPAPTSFGTVSVTVVTTEGAGSTQAITVHWQAAWHREAPPIEIRLPGCAALRVPAGETSVQMVRASP
jgi:hypothetical protein